MEIATLTKGPEKVFIVVRNDDGASIAIGTPLEWKADGTNDGIDVQAIQTATVLGLMPGAAHVSVADQKYFRAQVYGYDNDVVIYHHGISSASTLSIGQLLFGSSGGALTCLAAGGVHSERADFAAMATLDSAAASTTITNHAVFIRCM